MFVFHICLCCAVSCSLVVACWERDDPLDILCIAFSCVCLTFPYASAKDKDGAVGHV